MIISLSKENTYRQQLILRQCSILRILIVVSQLLGVAPVNLCPQADAASKTSPNRPFSVLRFHHVWQLSLLGSMLYFLYITTKINMQKYTTILDPFGILITFINCSIVMFGCYKFSLKLIWLFGKQAAEFYPVLNANFCIA